MAYDTSHLSQSQQVQSTSLPGGEKEGEKGGKKRKSNLSKKGNEAVTQQVIASGETVAELTQLEEHLQVQAGIQRGQILADLHNQAKNYAYLNAMTSETAESLRALHNQLLKNAEDNDPVATLSGVVPLPTASQERIQDLIREIGGKKQNYQVGLAADADTDIDLIS